MTAEVHNLKIRTKYSKSLKKQGLIQCQCGSTHFHLTVSGRVMCHKCRTWREDVFVTDEFDKSLGNSPISEELE